MKLKTTTCGSCPKPLRLRRYAPQFHTKSTWSREGISMHLAFLEALKNDHELRWLLDGSTRAAIRFLDEAGVDIPAHPEQERANYVDHLLMRMDGFDYVNLAWKNVRGVQETYRPRIVGPIRTPGNLLAEDWRISQSFSNAASGKPILMTLPGVATIIDSVSNDYPPYEDVRLLRKDVVAALRMEVQKLYEDGCRDFQIDDAYLTRDWRLALDHGIEDIERVIHGLPGDAMCTLHMCRGYTNELDQENYPKADKVAYMELAEALDASIIGAVSLEDAYEYNDLALFEKFKRITVVLGVVSVVKREVEPVKQIADRIRAVHERIGDSKRLWISLDCGGAMLPQKVYKQKVRNMTAAVASIDV